MHLTLARLVSMLETTEASFRSHSARLNGMQASKNLRALYADFTELYIRLYQQIAFVRDSERISRFELHMQRRRAGKRASERRRLLIV